MRYFIGYVIKGEAGDWHNSLAKTISEKFGTRKLHEIVPPHLTIFQPFTCEDLGLIKNLLMNWVDATPALSDVRLWDYDRFDGNVIFVTAEVEEQAKELIAELKNKIKSLPNMPQDDFDIWHPHATLASRLTPQEANKIWEYVSILSKPDFVLPFNNITLFRLGEDGKWVVEETFLIGNK